MIRVEQSIRKRFFWPFFTYSSKTIKQFKILTGTFFLLQVLCSTTFIHAILLEKSTQIGQKLFLAIFDQKSRVFKIFIIEELTFFPNMMYAY